ncbi:MAG: hypothetical protein KDI27_05785 [Gammaproteobacteria bacterium]|nr:hypothetical protein [Gammaproteobacteria bacterium]
MDGCIWALTSDPDRGYPGLPARSLVVPVDDLVERALCPQSKGWSCVCLLLCKAISVIWVYPMLPRSLPPTSSVLPFPALSVA